MTAAVLAPRAQGYIDRAAWVGRHAIHLDRLDPENPLTVGNGDFAFTVDVTGLQSFGSLYHDRGVPLETRATWAWHEFPNPSGLRLQDAMKPYPFHGRTVEYAALQDSPAGEYFRENPHPIPLGEISLLYRGRPLAPADVSAVDQTLDLWTGVVTSRYLLGGEPVAVETAADPARSLLSVRLRSPLVARGDLQVRFHFPYSYQMAVKNKPPFDWSRPDRHRTELVRLGPESVQLRRTLDESAHYAADIAWHGVGEMAEAGPHDFRLAAAEGDTLALTCEFTPTDALPAASSPASVEAASARGWKDYWTRGGAVDLSASADPRAAELERRIVLSLYLMRVNYGGHFPPAESGLVHISWYGKHNSEVYFWHAAQFYEWGHVELLERGLDWYRKILPSAEAEARSQGFAGARWPKMSGPDGRTGPGTINPFIIWNEPNPIYLSELVYRARPERATLERYRGVVFGSADFLASFAFLDPASGRYVLGPPIKASSEGTEENQTRDPAFELAFWHYGLQVAQAWRQRLGLPPDPRWADVLARLMPLPQAQGRYLEIETSPHIYDRPGGRLPTSELMALGYLPQTDAVDPAVMRRTFDAINHPGPSGPRHWGSWSLGEGALTAARLGEPAAAAAIVSDSATRFRLNGLVPRPAEPLDCPAYLPVNAALLDAVGLMAGGWDGAPTGVAPGFPRDGRWSVRAEGLYPMP
ncbi:MAG TPA: hypothetical protein VHC86_14055 [Opitutaceae bacterium]|nr:hypothetical protein [Opitutaceae bacterium]